MKKLILLIALNCNSVLHAADWQNKVSAKILSNILTQDEVELIIRLHSPEIIKKPSKDRIEKINNVVQQLKQIASTTQKPVLKYLNEKGIIHQSFWISNDILIKAPAAVIPEILSFEAVEQAFSNDRIVLNTPHGPTQAIENPSAIEWNVTMVNAPDVWGMGYNGQNVVVAGQDTGYQWDHPALINQYRGWDGQTSSHDYNWHDSISSPQINCGVAPCDDNSHGSHTMGTVLGDDGSGNQTGIAPGARWIGCRNMDEGDGTPATYTECYQWFLAPTDMNGNNPDSAKAPHIINNSWACPISEGCSDPNVLLNVVNNVVSAGILVVVSAGNSGSSCNTITTPSAIYDKSFTVGSTTASDEIAFSSSRGNVTVDGSNRIKPDISAPGAVIRSADNNSGYTVKSGTSMAAPNVAGVAALLISAKPELAGNPELIEYILTQTAVAKTTNQSCGGVSGSAIPNNTYGHGRIDALAAVNYALDLIYLNGFE